MRRPQRAGVQAPSRVVVEPPAPGVTRVVHGGGANRTVAESAAPGPAGELAELIRDQPPLGPHAPDRHSPRSGPLPGRRRSAHRPVDTFAGYLGNDWAGTVEVRAFPPILGCRPTDCTVYSIPPLIEIVVNSAGASKRSN